ncbi:helix-turn-helix domain-containing protein [Bradyrhizobium sp. ISRA463]|uniref:TetR/AcrR family transcriptional regulator n=1 Tax=Bradyrhizobium sp. ISRA463 TaxID=2866199 RepID=UPI0024793933|nr:helix-turn-helix domain-containing protein [Bradyrhizobium sp. ISRA463]WGS19898.1 TetR/AcrR family transcriptional regulator [Bradyrhizobium sp. ISRA463]
MVDRRIELLDAAARAFMRQGFAATSLDRVSDEIGSTKGAIYYYYRSKSELFFAVHRRGMELTEAAIRPPSKWTQPRGRASTAWLSPILCSSSIIFLTFA